MLNIFKRLKEQVHIVIYDSERSVRKFFRYAVVSTTIFAISSFILYYGFSLSQQTNDYLLLLIAGSLIVYILNFLAQLIYAHSAIEFIKTYWLEAIVVLVLIYDGISLIRFDVLLMENVFIFYGIKNFQSFYVLGLMVYIMSFAITEIIQFSKDLRMLRIHAVWSFIFTMAGMIGLGTLLLLLPEATKDGVSLSISEAFFTATSSITLTGLNVISPTSDLSFKGQFILLFLIQIGGIVVISFASFFAFFLKRGVGLNSHTILQDFMGSTARYNFSAIFRDILWYTIVIEMIGLIFIYLMLPSEMHFTSFGSKLFFALFHAVSGFNNAGFTLIPGGLEHGFFKHAYMLHFVFMFLVIMGALGFPAMKNLFARKAMQERMLKPWKRWKTSTSIAIWGTALLGLGGGLCLYLIEMNNTFKDENLVTGLLEAVFHAVNRSSGLNTIDMSGLAPAASVLVLFLMFIGGASGSVAGGIKTSTFFILMLSISSTIKSHKEIVISKRTISFDLLQRAYSIFTFSFLFILLEVFLLSITEPNINIRHLTFEAVSAFSLSGWSNGITPILSPTGQAIVTVSMFAGRIGTIVLAFALTSSKSKQRAFLYPARSVMVG